MAEPTPEDSAEAAADAAAELLAAAAALESPAVESSEASPEPSPGDSAENDLACVPEQARGLLRIRVPVTVTLAAQRKSVQEIIELGPGAIVKFEKTCDEPLELSVGNRPVATGEVVKVGDKFGLRIGRLVKIGETT